MLIPLPQRRRLGALFGRVFSYLPTIDQRIAKLQLKSCGFPSKLVHNIYEFFGAMLAEVLSVKELVGQVEIDPRSRATYAQFLERGGLVLSAHLSNWELLAAFFSSLGKPIVPIGRFAKSAGLQQALAIIRAESDTKPIWREAGAANIGLVLEIRRAIKNYQVVSALIDQDVDLPGTPVPFFGKPAHTLTGLIDIALRMNAPIGLALMHKSNGRYHATFQLISGETANDVAKEYNLKVEDAVRQCPEQWVWFHKRWRRTESGERMSSKKYEKYLRATFLIICFLNISCNSSVLRDVDALVGDKRYQEAINILKKEDSGKAFVNFELARIYRLQGALDKAADVLGNIRAGESSEQDLRLIDEVRELSRAYEARGNQEAAYNLLLKYRELDRVRNDIDLDRLAR